jgi:hypothetical protein
MYHKLANVVPVGDLILEATFCNGVVKRYDVSPLVARWKAFEALRTVPGLFRSVRIDAGGYGIVWNDELDLECEEIWNNGFSVPASTTRYPDIEIQALSVAEPGPSPIS